MKVLIPTGALFPQPGNNAVLLSLLLPYLQGKHQLRYLSFSGGKAPPSHASYQNVPVTVFQDDFSRPQHLLCAVASKLVDRNGFSDYYNARLMLRHIENLDRLSAFDALIATMEPFFAADAVSRMPGKKKILYLMDPPAMISNGTGSAYRDRRIRQILEQQDLILTTPFIQQALLEHGLLPDSAAVRTVGFPLIEDRRLAARPREDGKIRLLFCGWLYSDIRSPRYFLDILSRLDECFAVTFMGRECEKLTERFAVHTKAELITLPQQPYEAALQAMADADVLINIGNSVPVHMPSKTLEYINTGKPIVNFYKMDNCPTLYYTNRYPLCLNLSEREAELDAAAARFIDFCVTSKGKVVDRGLIEREYADCAPQYIANVILDALES